MNNTNDKNKKLIFKLGNCEISDELDNVIQKLENNEFVDIEEIENTTEFKLGNQMIDSGIETIKIDGRQNLQSKIIKEMSQRGSITYDKNGNETFYGPVNKDKRLDIVIGLPASGKSSSVVNVISEELKSVIIDNDEVKKLIPEYKNGWGASIVHEESKEINDKLFKLSLDDNRNIVLAKVGGFKLSILLKVLAAKSKGYTVNLHYVELNKNKALLRLLKRFIKDGRFLSPSLIYENFDENNNSMIKETFKELIKDKKINGYSVWDNDVNFGERPILKEYNNLDDNFILNARTFEEKEIKKTKFDKNYDSARNILIKKIKIFNELNNNIDINEINNSLTVKDLYLVLIAIKLNLKFRHGKLPDMNKLKQIIKEKITEDKSTIDNIIEKNKRIEDINLTEKEMKEIENIIL